VTDGRLVEARPPLVYQKEGKRLLAVSREAMRRIELCSFAYRLTGGKRFFSTAPKRTWLTVRRSRIGILAFSRHAGNDRGLALGYDCF